MSQEPEEPALGREPNGRRGPAASGDDVVHPWQRQASGKGVPAASHATDQEPPRLAPKPIQRPAVDPAHEAVFSRPSGVSGSFARPANHVQLPRNAESAPPPPEALAQAFSRPPGSTETLQRAPGERPPENSPAAEPVLLDGDETDPWRDPAAPAVLGPPFYSEDRTEDAEPAERGPLLSAREVLFGRRVHPRALAALGAVALLIGAAGGFLGRITAEEGNPLVNPNVTLAEVEPNPNRPQTNAAAVAQRVVPAVVSVEVRIGAQGGTGSGVVIDGNGYVVTNNHVVSMAADTPNAEVFTVFHDGTRAPARIVGRDPKTDLAVLKVEVANPTVAQLGDSDSLSVGDEVIAIGSPLGLASTVTTGIVSSVHRPVRLAGQGTDTNAVIDAIQTDAAINPGNSGGALVDSTGAVIGINSAIRTLGAEGEGGSIGLGFAIPIDDVRRIAEELIRTGQVRHADLGVNAKSVTDGLSDGAQVQNVRDGSAAAKAGIAEGDVIIKVGDRQVRSADELIVAVDRHRVGERVPVTLVRQGRELVLDVTLQ
ncbi:trypsin-like peptidase domain-containing protein [Saccharopolyspora rectivirgula]|uniref:trypsin-like peptidase domain-containing protein n=1 Tax=Saccharopolyspora rectivirgula TaxID=28042 RepID=UPI0024094543|nr:trypsin-like peptidase domain-containing protein [Saccharopolyspora rectivirgula]